ncbi:S8 family serine peptidase [Natronobacterium texcoconense]|uniref:Subtilase family protein n=1 Tax=Natronobacterium texcoconense TaxID=1095778 RepID=A0A1H1J3X2_NATTX|nr:S8 family serine peptidase [Natronobacterium texcoconense]SDR44707.1 Subtilase family protein [Natronobacterium texcoconense]
MTGSSGASSTFVTLSLCLLLVCSSVAVGLGASSAGAVAGDRSDTVDDATLEIDDELEEASGSVEIVVRLEEPPLADATVSDETEAYLEGHAAETQEPLLEYVDETPGASVHEEFWVTNAVVLEVDLGRVDLEAFAQFDDVEAVHENFEVPLPEVPDEQVTTLSADALNHSSEPTADESVKPTTGIDTLNAPFVWDDYDVRGEGVRVAVLDTGIDPTHPDLDLYTEDPSDPTYPGGWAEFDGSGERVEGSTPHDVEGHGTHVSGTVAGGNDSGIAVGVAPEAELLHGQVLGENGGSFAQIVAGLEWALEADADVINLSLGADGAHPELVDPVRNAAESDTVVVGAVGNDGPGTSGSPGNVYETLGVGAVDDDGAVASFSGGERLERSNWTTDWGGAPADWPDSYVVPDVVAPGVAVESTAPGGEYARLPGTSMATPHVSGTVALLLSLEPNATSEEVTTAVTDTTWKPDGESAERDVRYGDGIVDAEAAVDHLLEEVDSGDSSAVMTESDGTATNGTAIEAGNESVEEAAVDATPGFGSLGAAVAFVSVLCFGRFLTSDGSR